MRRPVAVWLMTSSSGWSARFTPAGAGPRGGAARPRRSPRGEALRHPVEAGQAVAQPAELVATLAQDLQRDRGASPGNGLKRAPMAAPTSSSAPSRRRRTVSPVSPARTGATVTRSATPAASATAASSRASSSAASRPDVPVPCRPRRPGAPPGRSPAPHRRGQVGGRLGHGEARRRQRRGGQRGRRHDPPRRRARAPPAPVRPGQRDVDRRAHRPRHRGERPEHDHRLRVVALPGTCPAGGPAAC